MAPASGQNTARVLGQVSQKKKLGEILVEQKLLTQEQVDYAIRKAEKDRVLVGNLLVSEGLISEVDLARCVAIQAEMPFIDLEIGRAHV